MFFLRFPLQMLLQVNQVCSKFDCMPKLWHGRCGCKANAQIIRLRSACLSWIPIPSEHKPLEESYETSHLMFWDQRGQPFHITDRSASSFCNDLQWRAPMSRPRCWLLAGLMSIPLLLCYLKNSITAITLLLIHLDVWRRKHSIMNYTLCSNSLL